MKRLAVALAPLNLTMTVVSFWLMYLVGLRGGELIGDETGRVVGWLFFALVGSLIAHHRPEHPIGWVLLVMGSAWVMHASSALYATYGVVTAPGSLPGAGAASHVQAVAWVPGLTGLPLALLLFPTGRPPSRRWRPVLWLIAAGGIGIASAAVLVSATHDPRTLVEQQGQELLAGPAEVLANGYFVIMAAVLLSVVSLMVRFIRSRGEERQQLKWVMFAGVVLVVSVVPAEAAMGVVGDLLATVALATLPLSMAAAVLRYRLYEIDRIVSRTLSYALVVATLALMYLGSVMVIQRALGRITGTSDVAVAASTLAVVAAFGPVRRRIQSTVDRRFNRSRYDAARTIERFSSRLRDEVNLDTLGAELSRVAADTMHPAHVSLWLRTDAVR